MITDDLTEAARAVVDLLVVALDVKRESIHELHPQAPQAARELMKLGVIHINQHGRYQMVGTPCPVLTAEMRLCVDQAEVPLGYRALLTMNVGGPYLPVVALDQLDRNPGSPPTVRFLGTGWNEQNEDKDDFTKLVPGTPVSLVYSKLTGSQYFNIAHGTILDNFELD